MVDAVNAVSVLTSTTRQPSREAVAATSQSAEVQAPEAGDFVTSHIRVDNLQNVAILEYRSSETGEVVRQYPEEAHIAAFKRAESLETKRQPSAPPTVSAGEGGEIHVSAPAPAPTPAPSTVQAAPSADAESGSTSVLA